MVDFAQFGSSLSIRSHQQLGGKFAVLDLDSGSVGVDGGSRKANEQQKDEGAAEVGCPSGCACVCKR